MGILQARIYMYSLDKPYGIQYGEKIWRENSARSLSFKRLVQSCQARQETIFINFFQQTSMVYQLHGTILNTEDTTMNQIGNVLMIILQTGMRGAFGKPQGTVARVHSGQVIMSIRTKLQNKEHIHISKKWGFTKFNADEFENMVVEKRLIPDACGVKYIPNRGPLDKWRALRS
ncbi:hypothetical protein FD755_016460 [Muntiacus reevesi]|uniref:Ribosomal protein L10e/L16 domain-containing protein n=1 Tax=Muntiacus reevesi TaxID=9886 RepID=A0A5N3XE52_MUNRE|nr:hypothetical protein FD755_016460 [Muntiacus reevesi]